jgi:hypothetical protein
MIFKILKVKNSYEHESWGGQEAVQDQRTETELL